MNKLNTYPFEKRISSLKVATLEAFITVAKLGSFSKAAKDLHLSQPSISRQIAQLEQAMDTQLFDRLTTRVVLTEPGRHFLNACQQSIDGIYQAKQQLSTPNTGLIGELKLSVSGYIAESFLHPILATFIKAHPAVVLDIHLISHSKQSYLELETGQADLVLATLPKKNQAPLKQLAIWEDPLYFVTSKQHALAKHSKISLQTLSQTPAIVPNKNTTTRHIIDSCFAQEHLRIQQAPQVPPSANFILIKTLLSLGLGWGVLPQHILDAGFKKLPIQTPPLSRKLGIMYHANRALSSAAQTFIHLCQEKHH